MKIAVACDGQNVAEHFGRCDLFRVFDETDSGIGTVQEVQNAPEGHSAAISVLLAERVDAVIVGGIGARAVELLRASGICVHAGATGSAEEAARDLVSGELRTSDTACDHHGDSHDHECGQHAHSSHRGGTEGTCNHNHH